MKPAEWAAPAIARGRLVVWPVGQWIGLGRVIGLTGEEVTWAEGRAIVDGRPLATDEVLPCDLAGRRGWVERDGDLGWIASNGSTIFRQAPAVRVPDGSVLVATDHRELYGPVLVPVERASVVVPVGSDCDR